MEESPSREINNHSASQEKPSPFMKPEDSLPYSKTPTNDSYPASHVTTPFHPLFLTSILILSSHLPLHLPFRFSNQNILCISHLSPICATCPAHLILLYLMILKIFGEASPHLARFSSPQ